MYGSFERAGSRAAGGARPRRLARADPDLPLAAADPLAGQADHALDEARVVSGTSRRAPRAACRSPRRRWRGRVEDDHVAALRVAERGTRSATPAPGRRVEGVLHRLRRDAVRLDDEAWIAVGGRRTRAPRPATSSTHGSTWPVEARPSRGRGGGGGSTRRRRGGPDAVAKSAGGDAATRGRRTTRAHAAGAARTARAQRCFSRTRAFLPTLSRR